MQPTHNPGSSERQSSSSSYYDSGRDDRFDRSPRRDDRDSDYDREGRRWDNRRDDRSQGGPSSQGDYRHQSQDQYRDSRYDASGRGESQLHDRNEWSQRRQYDAPGGRLDGGYGLGPSPSRTGGQTGFNSQRSPGQVMHSDYGFGSGSGAQGSDRQHAGKGPKGFQRSDDRINEECSQNLQDDGQIDASEVEVSVKGGEVTLTGTVADRSQKRAAEHCCDCVRGVHDVHNQLRVKREDRSASASTSTSPSARSGNSSSSSSTSKS